MPAPGRVQIAQTLDAPRGRRPSFYAFYVSWLGYLVPYNTTAAVLLFIGGIIGAIGASLGPETKDVDF